MRSILTCTFLLPGLWLALYGIGSLGDAQRAAHEVSESRALATVMVCQDGQIVRHEVSIFDRITGNVFHSGYFQCTDWRMREAS
jgi:hypothetical protein